MKSPQSRHTWHYIFEKIPLQTRNVNGLRAPEPCSLFKSGIAEAADLTRGVHRIERSRVMSWSQTTGEARPDARKLADQVRTNPGNGLSRPIRASLCQKTCEKASYGASFAGRQTSSGKCRLKSFLQSIFVEYGIRAVS